MAETEGKKAPAVAKDIGVRYATVLRRMKALGYTKGSSLSPDQIKAIKDYREEDEADKPERGEYEKKGKPATRGRMPRKIYDTSGKGDFFAVKIYPTPEFQKLLAAYNAKFAEYDQRLGELESQSAEYVHILRELTSHLGAMQPIEGRTFRVEGILNLGEASGTGPVKRRKRRKRKVKKE
jgi:uncharacterized protein YeaO (DUF488 family)